jgi:hypothetical protein
MVNRFAMGSARTMITVLAAVVLAAAVGLVIVTVGAHRTRREAEAFIQEVGSLQVGKSSFQEFNALRRKYQSHAVLTTPTCTVQNCRYAIAFGNEWLSKLFLTRQAFVGASLTFSDGLLHDIKISASCYGHVGTPPFVVSVTEALPAAYLSPTFYAGGQRSGDRQQSITVMLNPSATQKQHEEAYAFNLRFLDQFGPCHDAVEMLPSFAAGERNLPQEQ